jgi:hypothetical protein
MKGDAARSIVQTTIRRWFESGSVVTVDPTGYLEISGDSEGALLVQPGPAYPLGLGYSKNGFALKDEARVRMPLLSWIVWYYRQDELPEDITIDQLAELMQEDLGLSNEEMRLVFESERDWTPTFQKRGLSDEDVRRIVEESIRGRGEATIERQVQSEMDYQLEVRAMMTVAEGPRWLVKNPAERLRYLLEKGEPAILLYGPPSTSKTYAVNQVIAPTDEKRETIQVHEGWGYEQLVLGLQPDETGRWRHVAGPLLQAIRGGKSVIVLEEVNRTDFSQAIGEIFSLIEAGFRGPDHAITLADGSAFHIPREVCFIMTMNTIDRSTEDIDDALFGRVAAVEFTPRAEVLTSILVQNRVPEERSDKIRRLFAAIQEVYPLGHSYFAFLHDNTDPIEYYVAHIRPVLQKHLAGYRDEALRAIDEQVEELFG